MIKNEDCPLEGPGFDSQNLHRMVQCALHSHVHTPQTHIIQNKHTKHKWIYMPFLLVVLADVFVITRDE